MPSPTPVRDRRGRAGVARRGALRHPGERGGERTGDARRDRGHGRHRDAVEAGALGFYAFGEVGHRANGRQACSARSSRGRAVRARAPMRRGRWRASSSASVPRGRPAGAPAGDGVDAPLSRSRPPRLVHAVADRRLRRPAGGLTDESLRALDAGAGGAAGRGATLRHAARLPYLSRLQRSAHLPREARRPARHPTSCSSSWRSRRCERRSWPSPTSSPTRRCCSTACSSWCRARSTVYASATCSCTKPTPYRTDRGDGGGGWHPADHDAVRLSLTSTAAAPAQMPPFFNYAERNHDAICVCCCTGLAVSVLSDGFVVLAGFICDASSTFVLTHWARAHPRVATRCRSSTW